MKYCCIFELLITTKATTMDNEKRDLIELIDDFQQQALTNWLTKDHVNNEMTLREMMGTVSHICRKNELELGLTYMILDICFHEHFDLSKCELDHDKYMTQ